jgi:molecular chaperone DnaJ
VCSSDLEVLGVGREVSPEELKTAYRRLAVKYHPDRNPDDKAAEESFKECAEAYSVLSDPDKRASYDRFGHAGSNGAGFNGFAGFDDIFSHFSDIFSDVFGFSSRPRRGRAGADLRYDLEISFEQAIFGSEVELTVPRLKACSTCAGTGARPGSQPTPCPTCRGRGQVYASQGFFTVTTACPTCRGQGRVLTDPCPACRGQARLESRDRVKVKIPAGVDDGSRLRLRGEGEDGLEGGPAGDLYVILHVGRHEHFVREEDDLYYQLNLSMARAALGCEVEVPRLGDSPAKLKIPAGIQSGHQLRLKGEGVPRLPGRGHGRGDLIVEVTVQTPTHLGAREKELLAELAGLEEAKAGQSGLLGRFKSKKAAKS